MNLTHIAAILTAIGIAMVWLGVGIEYELTRIRKLLQAQADRERRERHRRFVEEVAAAEAVDE